MTCGLQWPDVGLQCPAPIGAVPSTHGCNACRPAGSWAGPGPTCPLSPRAPRGELCARRSAARICT